MAETLASEQTKRKNPTESLVPREVRFVRGDTPRRSSEAAVRKIVVRDAAGKPKELYFKRIEKGGLQFIKTVNDDGENVQRPLPPISVEKAQQIAEEGKAEYENILLCFGSKHVATTLYTVGTDKTYLHPQVHVYQEPIDMVMMEALGVHDSIPATLPNVRQRRKEILETLKKSVLEPTYVPSRKDQATINQILAQIKEHQEALKDFYPAYIESILLGLVPDLQYYDEFDDKTLVGLMFNHNLGIKRETDGKERVEIFDFGEPKQNLLSLEIRKKLRALINQHKQEGEVPIHRERVIFQREDVIVNKTRTNTFVNPDRVKLATWYRNALIDEITKWRGKEKAEAITTKIEYFLNIVGTPYQDSLQKDHEVYRRLCEAPPYETLVKIEKKILNGKSISTTTTVGNNPPKVEEYN